MVVLGGLKFLMSEVPMYSQVDTRYRVPVAFAFFYEETATPYNHTVGLCLGPYGGPRGVEVSYERGTPVRECGKGTQGQIPAVSCRGSRNQACMV